LSALENVIYAGAVQLQQFEHRLRVLPIVIVYLNNVCDSRCKTCEIWRNNQALKTPAARQMSDELLEDLYRMAAQWRPRQVLISGGEPTLHPGFPEAVARFARIAPEVNVITNGLSLGRCDKTTLPQAAAYYISFDAPDRDSYMQIRGVDGFDRLARTIDTLRLLTPRPKLVARCTLQRANVRRIPELVHAAETLGFDTISFLAADVSSEAFSRDLHGPSDISRIQPLREDLVQMERAIESFRDEEDRFIEGGGRKLRRILQFFRAVLGDEPFPPVHCNAPWVSVVIETSGQIRGCFFQPIIGHYRTINGEQAKKFRRGLHVATDHTCRRCVCSKYLGLRGLL
jgi:MoaA/NifB/PqqE/SkfB family radical SAM enzyme